DRQRLKYKGNAEMENFWEAYQFVANDPERLWTALQQHLLLIITRRTFSPPQKHYALSQKSYGGWPSSAAT
ncbi:MAG: hypothetical protein AAFX52_04055, partial [Pseudomonadota bacterium]